MQPKILNYLTESNSHGRSDIKSFLHKTRQKYHTFLPKRVPLRSMLSEDSFHLFIQSRGIKAHSHHMTGSRYSFSNSESQRGCYTFSTQSQDNPVS